MPPIDPLIGFTIDRHTCDVVVPNPFMPTYLHDYICRYAGLGWLDRSSSPPGWRHGVMGLGNIFPFRPQKAMERGREREQANR